MSFQLPIITTSRQVVPIYRNYQIDFPYSFYTFWFIYGDNK